MWIKQFVRETVDSKGWEFEDKYNQNTAGISIKSGTCDKELKEFFDEAEVDEIKSLIGNTDPKKKNITQESGQLLDSNGVKIDEELSLPSHWGWCSWKVNKEMVDCGPHHVDLHQRLHILFRCDGKCNTNNGDNQKWDKYSYSYVNIKTNKQENPKRPYEVIQGLR